MIVKDFSDELIALYENTEDTEDTKETTTSSEVVENSAVTALTVTELKDAHELLQNANPVLAGWIEGGDDRYRISFANLEKAYSMSTKTSGLLEFWTVIKLMVESKTDWSGRGMTNSWTHRLVNAFYKPALTEVSILAILQQGKYEEYKFRFNSADPTEHYYFFTGPGSNTPDFFSDKLKTDYSGRSSKPGTVECKPATTTSNAHTAAYVLRYISLYASDSGKFWFETKLKTVNIPDGFPTRAETAENFKITTFDTETKVKLDGDKLDSIYKELCKDVVSQTDHNELAGRVEDQLKTVNDLEKKYFVDTNHSLKDVPPDFNVATKRLNTLINRKAEVAKLLPKSAEVQAESFMKTYEELNTLN